MAFRMNGTDVIPKEVVLASCLNVMLVAEGVGSEMFEYDAMGKWP